MRGVFKKAIVLTLPAPARQDAPFHEAAASEEARRYIPHFV
jgi:hypothetical protein